MSGDDLLASLTVGEQDIVRAEVLARQDGTVWPDGIEPHGYLVGQREWNLRIGHNLRAAGSAVGLAAFWIRSIELSFDGIAEGYRTIGSWTDTDTNDLHLDVSYIYDNLDAALNVAKIKGELAIWDVANEREIRTHETKRIPYSEGTH